MKIGILTHPQGTNYGGILQCYALCTYLHKMGHEPIVIRRTPNQQFFLFRWARAILKALHYPRYYKPYEVDTSVNIRPFVDKYIPRTEPLKSGRSMNRICKKYRFGAVIVGSDQVWRQDFSVNYGYNYFLDFVPNSVIKASYAASFGLNEWRYTEQQTEIIKKCLSTFKGISVREEEAVGLIKENLGIDAIQHVDPTLLLTSEDYDKIASPRLVSGKYVFVYWLGDKSIIEKEIIQYQRDGYDVVEINLRDNIELPSVGDWLSYIKYANCMITDSFHGCVFSIIYGTSLLVRFNKSGGIGRISSLFNMLGMSPKSCNNTEYAALKIQKNRFFSKDYFNQLLK